MRISPRRFQASRWTDPRQRMIAETELALLVGLRFPNRVRRIPTVEAGRGVFHPAFAARFWADVLQIAPAELAALGNPDAEQSVRLSR